MWQQKTNNVARANKNRTRTHKPTRKQNRTKPSGKPPRSSHAAHHFARVQAPDGTTRPSRTSLERHVERARGSSNSCNRDFRVRMAVHTKLRKVAETNLGACKTRAKEQHGWHAHKRLNQRREAAPHCGPKKRVLGTCASSALLCVCAHGCRQTRMRTGRACGVLRVWCYARTSLVCEKEATACSCVVHVHGGSPARCCLCREPQLARTSINLSGRPRWVHKEAKRSKLPTEIGT